MSKVSCEVSTVGATLRMARAELLQILKISNWLLTNENHSDIITFVAVVKPQHNKTQSANNLKNSKNVVDK